MGSSGWTIRCGGQDTTGREGPRGAKGWEGQLAASLGVVIITHLLVYIVLLDCTSIDGPRSETGFTRCVFAIQWS